jgi:stress response protein YsnF
MQARKLKEITAKAKGERLARASCAGRRATTARPDSEPRRSPPVASLSQEAPMSQQQSESVEEVIPLVEEHLTISKRTVETGRVRVFHQIVRAHRNGSPAELQRDDVTVERVPIDREIEAVPEVPLGRRHIYCAGGRRGAGRRKAPCSQRGAEDPAAKNRSSG